MIKTLLKFIKTAWTHSSTTTIGLFVALLYATGFAVWNTQLAPFGFFEYNLLQVRFIAAGFIFLLVIFLLILILDFVLSHFDEREVPMTAIVTISLLLGILLLIYFQNIFIFLPQSLGGGRPIPTTILGTEEQIEYLASLGVQTAENAEGKKPVQTRQICLIYQNDSYVVFQSINESGVRNITLLRDKFIGFSSVNPNASIKGCNTFP